MGRSVLLLVPAIVAAFAGCGLDPDKTVGRHLLVA